MKELKVNAFETIGCAVTVKIEGNVSKYAESFLHIFNNVRANKELLKVKNYYDSNDVTVYCEPDCKESLIGYLKMFGEITGCERVLLYRLEEPEYDLDKYTDVVLVPDFD